MSIDIQGNEVWKAMNKSWFYLGVIGSLATLTTSCSDGKPPTPAASPAVVASPTATVPPTAPATSLATTPSRSAAAIQPTVPGKSIAVKPVSVDVAAGLIPSTEGDIWAKTVSKGRADPFGMLSLQPIEIIDPIEQLTQPVKSKVATNQILPTTKSGITKIAPLRTIKVTKISGKQIIARKGNGVTPAGVSSQQGTITVSAIPKTEINKSLAKIVVAPAAIKKQQTPLIAKTRGSNGKSGMTGVVNKAPVVSKIQFAAKPEKVAEKPLQAMAIEISGVIDIGGQTQVIIKMPTESFSRYIEVGDRIGNGKVLVKRVEGQSSLSPTIVLEEVGIEVLRKIGDRSTAPTDKPAPAKSGSSTL